MSLRARSNANLRKRTGMAFAAAASAGCDLVVGFRASGFKGLGSRVQESGFGDDNFNA